MSRTSCGRAILVEIPGPAWSEAVLGHLGKVVAEAPEGQGVMIEQSKDDPRPLASASDASLADQIARRLSSGVARIAQISETRPPAPPVGWSDCILEVLPRVESESRTRTRAHWATEGDERSLADSWDRFWPPTDPTGSLGGWWALQLHWISLGNGRLAVRARYRLAAPVTVSPSARDEWTLLLREHLAKSGLPPYLLRWKRVGGRLGRRWQDGSLGRCPIERTFSLDPRAAARLAFPPSVPRNSPGATSDAHTVVFGASGAGKTTYLAHLGGEWARRGSPLVAFDLHGDLAPRLTAQVPAKARETWVAIDAEGPVGSIPGLDVLGSAGTGNRDREAAMVVAALRRLSSDGDAVYWGFRLERIFDVMVRLVQEAQGDLLDVYELLTDARRRAAARLSTRSATLAGFLEEIPTLTQRNPEFLWPAAARLSKVALLPTVAALVTPRFRSFDLGRALNEGTSLVWRIPLSTLGPEASAFVASLLAGRVYLEYVARTETGRRIPKVLFLLDEVHALAPRLVLEILAEGRKFGIHAVLATQYPERLGNELRLAAQGAAGTHVVFRVPPAAAGDAGRWAGLSYNEARELLPSLSPGIAIVSRPGELTVERFPMSPGLEVEDRAAWAEAVTMTGVRNPANAMDPSFGPTVEVGEVHQALLMAAFGSQAAGENGDRAHLLARLRATSDLPVEAETALTCVDSLVHRGWLETKGSEFDITPAGLAALGATAPTGAVNESAEHRALLIETFRIFAARGYRLEVLRQGRFDVRLPDAIFLQLSRSASTLAPADLATRIDRIRSGWAWKFFGGKNVNVEAEVSGALRSDRIRHGLVKARRTDAYALFVVSTSFRARAVRRVLERRNAYPHLAQVWTLRRVVASSSGGAPPSNGEGPSAVSE